MNLIQPFEALIKNGVSLTFKISAAGEQIQLNILPTGKDSKTGVALPPKALFGTAAELDQHLEEFASKYAASVTRIADVVATADADLEKQEKEASETARKAVEDKRANKAPAKPGVKSTSSTTPSKKRDMGAGLIDDEGGGGDDEDEDEDSTNTTLDTTGAGAGETPAPAAAPASPPASEALSPELF